MRGCGGSSVGRASTCLTSGRTCICVPEDPVKKGDVVVHTFNLSTWEVERNGWGEREKEGKGGRKERRKREGRKRIVFSLDSVFSIVDETLSGVSATHTGF